MVRLIRTTQEIIPLRETQGKEVGFVPTMGNLHAGHISLLNEALKNCKIIYFSIFVNPKQFGPNEDFKSYPRTLEDDVKKIEIASLAYPDKEIFIYAPQNPEEVFSEGHNETVIVAGLNDILEGKIRPGHFDGVSTVVHRLFEIIRPAKAYFGLKDFQQYRVIEKMVADLQMQIEIVGMPIIRETSGLAMSSRNQYLSDQEREEALTLKRALDAVKKIIDGKRENIIKAKNYIQEALSDKRWNYLEIRDALTLSSEISESSHLTLLGVFQLRSTRLLDNMQVDLK
jgi:pantoate--beta-alanine ligase